MKHISVDLIASQSKQPLAEAPVTEIRQVTSCEIFVHDDRYSVPTLHLVTVRDLNAAHAAAHGLLHASPHHRGVELWRDGEQLLEVGACAERRPSGRLPEPLRLASGG